MSDPFEDLSKFDWMVPEGATAMYGMMLVVYLDSFGEIIDEYQTIGDGTLRDWLGTLDSIKFRMACDQFGVVRDKDTT